MAMPQYTEDEPMPGAEPQEPTPQQPPETEPGEPQETANEHTLFISPEHLGGLDPNDVNPGDILEFKVVGRDADGDIEVEYNTGKGNESGMDKIKSDLRDHMMQPAAENNPGMQAAGAY